MRAGDRVRWVLSGIGQTMITLGVVLLLFCVYELWVTNLYTDQQQKKADKALEEEWSAPLPRPTATLPPFKDGEGIARIYLPSLGKGQMHVVFEGVSTGTLKKGPGHYPGTAKPGEIGNFVISGHRTTYGAPFNRLDELNLKDEIVIETRTQWFTYRVTREFIVSPRAIDEVAPVPNQLGAKPTKALMTLTTCHPKYSARTRLLIRAELLTTLAKGPGVVPPALSSMLEG